jgi:hypothetical protein
LYAISNIDSYLWLPNERILAHDGKNRRMKLLDTKHQSTEISEMDFELCDYDANTKTILLQENRLQNSANLYYATLGTAPFSILNLKKISAFSEGRSVFNAYFCGNAFVCFNLTESGSNDTHFSVFHTTTKKTKKLRLANDIVSSRNFRLGNDVVFFHPRNTGLVLEFMRLTTEGSLISKGEQVLKLKHLPNILAVDIAKDKRLLLETMLGDKSIGLQYYDGLSESAIPVTDHQGSGNFEHSAKFYPY